MSNQALDGITNPPIDALLDKAGSKYSLVLYAAKRARQINAYYSQLGEGLLEYVGPLVETYVHEKPLSIALREINEGLLTIENLEPKQTTPARKNRHVSPWSKDFAWCLRWNLCLQILRPTASLTR